MADNKKEIRYFRGPSWYAKVFEAQPGYKGKGLFYTIDVGVNDKNAKMAKDQGLNVKNKDEKLKEKDKPLMGDFVSFKQNAVKKDGNPAFPPKVVDANGQKWPDGKKIGNGSIVDVKYQWIDYGDDMDEDKRYGRYLMGVRVLSLVEYEDGGFPPLDEDDEFFGKDAEERAIEDKINEVAETATDFDDLEDDDESPF